MTELMEGTRMQGPRDDRDAEEDHHLPHEVPTEVDVFGRPVGWVEVDDEEAGEHWDARLWRR